MIVGDTNAMNFYRALDVIDFILFIVHTETSIEYNFHAYDIYFIFCSQYRLASGASAERHTPDGGLFGDGDALHNTGSNAVRRIFKYFYNVVFDLFY